MEKLYKTLVKWSLGILYYSVRNQYLYKGARFEKIGQSEEKILFFMKNCVMKG